MANEGKKLYVPSLNSYLSTVRTNAILGTCVFKLVFLKVNTFDMFVQLGKILKNKNIFLKYVLKIHGFQGVTLFKFFFLTFHRLFCGRCTLKSEFSEKNKWFSNLSCRGPLKQIGTT